MLEISLGVQALEEDDSIHGGWGRRISCYCCGIGPEKKPCTPLMLMQL